MITSAPFPPREGIGFYVWNLSRYLAEQGHQVQIITRGAARRTNCECKDSITIWRPPFLPVYPWHVHLHHLFVERLLRKLAPNIDVFHLHSPLVKRPNIKAPVLVTVHTPMKADTAAIKLSNSLSVLIKLQAPISYLLEQDLFIHASKLVAVATSVANELTEYGIDSSRVSVLGNGVDTNIFQTQQYPEQLRQSPYFLTAGRLAPRKGLEDLIQVALASRAQLPHHRFFIAGTGPLEGQLRTDIERYHLEDRVVLLGHIAERDKLARLYTGATAYIHPAHYEGLATVMLEAMACARPVVATSVSGALDVIVHERNGLLVPARTPCQMVETLVRLVQNPEWAAQLGQAAQRTVHEHYSWDIVSHNYLAEYEKLIQGAAG